MLSDPAPPELIFHPVTTETWPALEALFMAPGGPKYCWCMVFRGTNAERKEWTAAEARAPASGGLSDANRLRRAALRRRVEAGTPIGLVGFAGGEPVAWVSVGPKPSYLRLGGPDDHPELPQAVWSLACMFLRRPYRRARLTPRLIAAAAAYAREGGAEVLEAYPVAADSPSFRFMGFVGTFEQAGFRKVGTAGTRRTVMRLDL